MGLISTDPKTGALQIESITDFVKAEQKKTNHLILWEEGEL